MPNNIVPSSFSPNRQTKWRIEDRPAPTSAHPDSAEYSDIGFFKTHLHYIKPPINGAHHAPAQALPSISLEALLHTEAMRQDPNFPMVSPAKQHAMLFNIASSCVDRYDIEAEVSLDALPHRHFFTKHQFAHNSPLNGKRYINSQGDLVEVSHAISASQDRNTEHPQMMRRIKSCQDTTLLYTGRPETALKAKEQAEWIFFNELRSAATKGVVKLPDPDANGRPRYELTYVVDSLLSPMRLADPNNRDRREREFLLDERHALANLAASEQIFIDPVTQAEYCVQCKPILISNAFNWAAMVHNVLPNSLGQASLEKEIASEGLDQLSNLVAYQKSLIQDNRYLSLLQKKDRLKKFDQVEKWLLNFHTFVPEKKVAALAAICDILQIPLTVHCMSSKDRTGICIALTSAFQHYKELNLYTGDLDTMLADERFKELFIANLMIGHNVANYGRGAKGELFGEQLDDLFGLEIGENQAFLRLLPQRYVSRWSPLILLKKTVRLIGALIAALTIFPLVWLVGLAIDTKSTITHFGGDLLRLLSFYKAVPDLYLNNKAPGVKDRGLKKAKEKHLLHPAIINLARDIESLSNQEYASLMQFMSDNPPDLESDTISSKMKSILMRLNLQRNTLHHLALVANASHKTMFGKTGVSKKIAEQLSPKACNIFLAAPSALIFQDLENSIDLYQRQGTWSIEQQYTDIADQGQVVDPRILVNLTNGNERFPDACPQTLAQHLQRAGIGRPEDIARIIATIQTKGESTLNQCFPMRTLVSLDQGSSYEVEIDSSESHNPKIRSTSYYWVEDRQLEERRLVEFTTIIAYGTRQGSLSFTIVPDDEAQNDPLSNVDFL